MIHRSVRAPAFLVLLALLALPALAQEAAEAPPMTPEQQAEMEAYMKAGTPGPEHAAMAATAGTYDLEIKSWYDPSAPPVIERGTAVRTMTLDGRVLVEEMSSKMMGRTYQGRLTSGFDNVTGKYWSTWTDSLSTGVMVSEGTCDDDGTCTYVGSWNDPLTKNPMKARMVIRSTGPDTELFEMHAPGPDGNEMKMMEIVYTKKK